ncbi:MAG: hypothetical protein ABSB22_07460 [Thermodesulfobacteriota bacterium]|jgi:hypothetical protein
MAKDQFGENRGPKQRSWWSLSSQYWLGREPLIEQITSIDPFSFAIDARSGIIIPHANLIQRRLSHMKGMFVDEAALKARLEIEESTSGNSRKKSLTF